MLYVYWSSDHALADTVARTACAQRLASPSDECVIFSKRAAHATARRLRAWFRQHGFRCDKDWAYLPQDARVRLCTWRGARAELVQRFGDRSDVRCILDADLRR